MNSPVQVSNSLRVFIGVVLVVAVMRYAQDVFVPLALAILMTFLLAPLVEFLQRWRRQSRRSRSSCRWPSRCR